MRICICGGGSLGHVCAGMLGSLDDVQVNILTRHPQSWQKSVVIHDINNDEFCVELALVTDNPEDAIQNCDIVFLCLPGYAIEEELVRIKPYIDNAIVGSIVSSTGFFYYAHKVFGHNVRLFGFQRTPFIARTVKYGSQAILLGYKSQVAIATENIEDREGFSHVVEKLWRTPCKLLDSIYEASLTNSNPILHTGRLYSMWKDWKGEIYDHTSLFYREWTDDASQMIVDMDNEFQNLLKALNITPGAIPTLLDYYECRDIPGLTDKLRNIKAFQSIQSPMKKVTGGWIPDFASRYFSEDFPYGLRFIWDLAHKFELQTPCIDKVYSWGMKQLLPQ